MLLREPYQALPALTHPAGRCYHVGLERQKHSQHSPDSPNSCAYGHGYECAFNTVNSVFACCSGTNAAGYYTDCAANTKWNACFDYTLAGDCVGDCTNSNWVW